MQALAALWGEYEPAMADLVREAQGGDATAFEALYRRNVGRVHAICRRLSADAGRAEELTQEVFLSAWRHLDSCPGEDRFTAWLCRLAIHRVLGASRSMRRRMRREIVGEVRDDAGRVTASDGPSPGLAIDLERAMDTLPSGARQVFVLHDVEGFRHEEIAGLLGISVGTSKAQLHRARRLLKEALGS